MKPGEFSLENAVEILPHELRQSLGAEARAFADSGADPKECFGEGGTHWDQVVREHQQIFWMDTYNRRRLRIARITERKRS